MSRFPINTIRSAFPALQARKYGNADHHVVDNIFFDNPAGTQVPAPVAVAISDAILYANANLGGQFSTSALAGKIYTQAHQIMADFLGAEERNNTITIAQSMTALTYNLSRSLAREWREGDEIIVTAADHDGNVSPWMQAAMDRGVIVKKCPLKREQWQLCTEDFAPLLSPRTKLVALNWASNMTGSINDLKPLIDLAHAHNALTFVDAVQYTPHRQVNVQALNCDFLTCSSYKFFGPHLGILYGKADILARLSAYKVRPAPAQAPGKFSHGTPQIELLAGLIACVDYFTELGHWIAEAEGLRLENNTQSWKLAYDAITLYEEMLSQRLIAGLLELPVDVMGITEQAQLSRRVPTVSFVAHQHTSSDIAAALAKRHIFCWSGHNYAYETAMQLGLDMQDGVVRLGMAHYNTIEEIDRTLEELNIILSK